MHYQNLTMEKEQYNCPKCNHIYDYPETNPAGCTFWNCPACGAEDGVHVSPAIEAMSSDEELAEIELKKNTFCSVKVVYENVSDIPKFKKYKPELGSIGNKKLIAKLSSHGGFVLDKVSLLEAENVKREAETFDLTVEIYA